MPESDSFTLDLPSEPGSIARARRAMDRIDPPLDEATRLNLRLVVSELVTNAIRHVPAEYADRIQVTVARTEDTCASTSSTTAPASCRRRAAMPRTACPAGA